MSQNIAAVRVVEPDDVPATSGLPDEVTVALSDIATVAREGLLALSVSTGLAVMTEMMEAEITERVGPKHAKLPGRTASRHSGAPTSVVLGGRKVPIVRPRARTMDNHEVALDTFAAFADEDLLNQVVLERMLAGVATRRHRAAAEAVDVEVGDLTPVHPGHPQAAGRAAGPGPVRAGRGGVDGRRDHHPRPLLCGGAGHHRRRHQGAGRAVAGRHREHHRGHRTAGRPGRPWDGRRRRAAGRDRWRQALAAGVRKVFGELALIQRCTLHKRRNVGDHLPAEVAPWVDRKLARAFAHDDPVQGRRDVLALASHLEDRWPDAAGSLREGLDQMFTVRRLGIDGRLARTLTCTNAIESMISIARDTCRHVKRWRDGKMVRRWVAAGMLNAERSFRRIKGCRQMPVLVAALRAHAAAVTPAREDEEAA